MASVIRILFSSRWRRSVYVGTDDLLSQQIRGPADAIRHMRDNFRCKSGPIYWHAFELCHAAVRGELQTEFARAPFVAACAEDDAVDRGG